MAAQWTARAAVLRTQPDRGSQTIAGALERISASLLAEVSAAASVAHVAALAAEGVSRVGGLQHLDRGYEGIEQKLAGLGASIQRSQSEAIVPMPAMRSRSA